MLKFGTPTIALPLGIKKVLLRLDALYIKYNITLAIIYVR